jgi:hypothetical protein
MEQALKVAKTSKMLIKIRKMFNGIWMISECIIYSEIYIGYGYCHLNWFQESHFKIIENIN